MLAPAVNRIARRVILDNFDIRHQGRPRKRAFDHVVAQQRSFGKPGIHQAMEGVDVVNSFANEAAFPKQILISVGNSASVYIESRVRREDRGQTRLAGRLQVHARLWLQDGVTPFQRFA